MTKKVILLVSICLLLVLLAFCWFKRSGDKDDSVKKKAVIIDYLYGDVRVIHIVYLMLGIPSIFIGIRSIKQSKWEKEKEAPFVSQLLLMSGALVFMLTILGYTYGEYVLCRYIGAHEGVTMSDYCCARKDNIGVLMAGTFSSMMYVLFYMASRIRYSLTKGKMAL